MKPLCRGWLLAWLVLVLTDAAEAQVSRLPPVSHDAWADSPLSVPPVAWPDLPAEARLAAQNPQSVETNDFAPAAPRSPARRQGFFQAAALSGTWLAPGGENGLGITELETGAWFAMPMPTPSSPLILNPGFALRLLEGPTETDLPAQLYDVYFELRHLRPLNPLWTLDLSVAPGVFTDFEAGQGDAFRIPAKAVVVYEYSPWSKFALGAAWLDRDDVPFLLVGGWIYRPHDAIQLDLVFPKPRFAYRLATDGCHESWAYIAGELGGGSWAIVRADGRQDVVSIRDYRLLLGWERTAGGPSKARLEVGYVFGRRVEYESDSPDFEPGGTLLLRAGYTY